MYYRIKNFNGNVVKVQLNAMHNSEIGTHYLIDNKKMGYLETD